MPAHCSDPPNTEKHTTPAAPTTTSSIGIPSIVTEGYRPRRGRLQLNPTLDESQHAHVFPLVPHSLQPNLRLCSDYPYPFHSTLIANPVADFANLYLHLTTQKQPAYLDSFEILPSGTPSEPRLILDNHPVFLRVKRSCTVHTVLSAQTLHDLHHGDRRRLPRTRSTEKIQVAGSTIKPLDLYSPGRVIYSIGDKRVVHLRAEPVEGWGSLVCARAALLSSRRTHSEADILALFPTIGYSPSPLSSEA